MPMPHQVSVTIRAPGKAGSEAYLRYADASTPHTALPGCAAASSPPRTPTSVRSAPASSRSGRRPGCRRLTRPFVDEPGRDWTGRAPRSFTRSGVTVRTTGPGEFSSSTQEGVATLPLTPMPQLAAEDTVTVLRAEQASGALTYRRHQRRCLS